MPNDYDIKTGRIISDSIVTSANDAEICRFTVPLNTDLRIDVLCVIQNQSDFTDGYSYRINGLVTRETGTVSFISGENYYNISGAETDMKIYTDMDVRDLVFKTIQNGTDAFRVAVFVTIYQVENAGIGV